MDIAMIGNLSNDCDFSYTEAASAVDHAGSDPVEKLSTFVILSMLIFPVPPAPRL